MDRTQLEKALPFVVGEFAVRSGEREDIDRRAEWPSYPEPYAMFDASAKNRSAERREASWQGMKTDPDSVHLSVGHERERLVAIFVLRDIDWDAMKVGNMSIRMHPDWCDRGNGSLLSGGIFEWCFRNGFRGLRLDVLSTNLRATRCYAKAGMKKTGEFMHGEAVFDWMERFPPEA